MKSIRQMIVKEIIIKKSTFINYLIPVSSLEETEDQLIAIKNKHRDASHHTFAYLLGEHAEVQKYSDDGEPSKTAGLPMMEVLKKHDVTNVLNVSVRYFGGIKLGASGLIRAYAKGCAESLKDAVFTSMVTFLNLSITISFDQIGLVELYLRENHVLLSTNYDNSVHYEIEIMESEYPNLERLIQDKTNGSATVTITKTFTKYI